MSVRFESKTDIGQKRRVNEDNLWPQTGHHDYGPEDPYGMLFIVADGIGGHGAGDVASGLAVAEIPKHYYSLEDEYTDIGERLRVAIQMAHQKIRERAAESPETQNMGTTVVAVVVKYDEKAGQGEAWLAWAGDSRAYRLRRGRLQQMTRDHSRIWPLIQAGELTWDEQKFHPDRSRVVNALAARQPQVMPEVERIELEPGDLLLLCSDGLSGEVRPETMEQILLDHPPRQALELLLEKANGPKDVYKDGEKHTLDGGNDNITSMIIRIPRDQAQTAVSASPSTLVAEAPVKPKKEGSSHLGLVLVLAALVAVLGLAGGGLFLLNSGSSQPPVVAGAATTPSPLPPTAEPAQGSVIVAVEPGTEEPTLTPTAEPTLPAEEAAVPVSETRAPTVTREPTPWPTIPALPTATASPAALPAITPAESSPEPWPVPVLLLPDPDETGQNPRDVTQEIPFMWQWPGELTDDLSFEIRVWRRGTNPTGAHDARLLKQQPSFERLENDIYTVNLVLQGAGGVTISSSDYLWSVSVVRISPSYEWLGPESASRPISLVVP